MMFLFPCFQAAIPTETLQLLTASYKIVLRNPNLEYSTT